MNDETASQGEAYREMVNNVGSDRPEQCWILTPYDTWERNPAYTGPDQPHPEDDCPRVDLNSFAERKAQVIEDHAPDYVDEDYERYYENLYDQNYRE
jgi:hypothetical protein